MKLGKIFCVSLVLMSLHAMPAAAQSNQGNSNQEKDDEVFTLRPRAQNAEIKSKPKAEYPEEAKGSGVTAVVRLRAILSSSGSVSGIRTLAVQVPDGLLTEVKNAFERSASEAARKIEFKPARKNGKPASQYVVLEYRIEP